MTRIGMKTTKKRWRTIRWKLNPIIHDINISDKNNDVYVYFSSKKNWEYILKLLIKEELWSQKRNT